jgi:TATA-box binding protein (TBP) (component of TFIID and TFIIIB)
MESAELFETNLSKIPNIKISTITTCVEINKKNLEKSEGNFEIDTLFEKISSVNEINSFVITSNYNPSIKKSVDKNLLTMYGKIVTKRKENKNVFYNCINAKMTNAKMTNAKMTNATMTNAKMTNATMNNAKMTNDVLNISLKIFKNGSIIFTGCKNIKNICDTIKTISELTNYEIINQRISLINCNFKYTKIDKNIVKDFINSRNFKDEFVGEFVIATLTQKHNNLNIKYNSNPHSPSPNPITNSNLTILIYSTGSICIMSAKNSNEIVQAYNDITKLITILSTNK